MDRTVASIISALKAEKQELLESLGDYPRADPFEHGLRVGMYQGLGIALEAVETVLNDGEVRDDQL